MPTDPKTPKPLPPGLDWLPSGRIRARYRCKGCARHNGKRGFHPQTFEANEQRKAVAWLKKQQVTVLEGKHVDPAAGKVTVEVFALEHLARQTFEESTREAVELRLRLHVFPVLGHLRMRDVKPSTVQAWVKGLGRLAPSYRRVIFANVSSIFAAAVDDEVILSNPCRAGSVTKPAR